MHVSHLGFQNILVIDFGQLGDVVLSLPALTALRRRFPDSHILVMTGRVPDQIVTLSGLADEVIMVDRVELRDGPRLRSIGKIFSFVRQMRRRRIDLVIDLHSLPETNILAYLTKAGKRLLANRENRSLDRLSNFRPAPPPEDKTRHLSDRYMDVLKPLGIDDGDANRREMLVDVPDGDAVYVAERFFADDESQTVGLFPGAGHPSRCWPLNRFAELARQLTADGVRPAVFLGPEESGMRAAVQDLFPDETVIIDGLSIPQFIAAAARLSVFVTNDTGPMHLAACAGVPIVLLLDEQAPTTYLPLTRQLEIVRSGSIESIPVDEVYQAAGSLLAKFRQGGK